MFSIAVLAISTAAFVLARVRTHFLGDGYNLLTQLEKGVYLVKRTGWGEALVHISMKKLLSGDDPSGALLSFRIISVAAGVIFLILVLVFAAAAFSRLSQRVLFTLGMLSGGYMLLFFGYVEYYSVFLLTLALFCLTALAIFDRRVPRWLIVPPQLLMIFMHVFGLIFLPATVYVLLQGTSLGNRLGKMKRRWHILFAGCIVVAGAGLFYYLYSADYFFCLSIVPIVAERYTLEGYTLFSVKHLADYLNILLIYMPALPIMIGLLFFLPVRQLFERPHYRFMLLILILSLSTAFVLDPNYGMARDWDLFSFMGFPLVLAGFYLLVDNARELARWRRIAVLGISLGALVLGPRVTSQVMPDVMIEHFRQYIDQNRYVQREGRLFLIEYYNRSRRTVEAYAERIRREREQTDDRLVARATELFDRGNITGAISLYRQALTLNPVHSEAYTNLGLCYEKLGEMDSAMTMEKLAYAVNPYNKIILSNLGYVHFRSGNYVRAEECWMQAMAMDSTLKNPRIWLLSLYRERGQEDKYEKFLMRLSHRDDNPDKVLGLLGAYYLEHGQYGKAETALKEGISKGLDREFIRQLKTEYPKLELSIE